MLLHPEDIEAIEAVVERVVEKKLAEAAKKTAAENDPAATEKGKKK